MGAKKVVFFGGGGGRAHGQMGAKNSEGPELRYFLQHERYHNGRKETPKEHAANLFTLVEFCKSTLQKDVPGRRCGAGTMPATLFFLGTLFQVRASLGRESCEFRLGMGGGLGPRRKAIPVEGAVEEE